MSFIEKSVSKMSSRVFCEFVWGCYPPQLLLNNQSKTKPPMKINVIIVLFVYRRFSGMFSDVMSSGVLLWHFTRKTDEPMQCFFKLRNSPQKCFDLEILEKIFIASPVGQISGFLRQNMMKGCVNFSDSQARKLKFPRKSN